MKNMKLCAILIFAFITLTNAQWLETTIYVPDSLCGIRNPRAFTYNNTNNTIYVGGYHGDCVIAIDGTTNEKIARIPAGEDIKALCWNSINNKIYCANSSSANVTVIDGATNAVITTIAVGDYPCAFAWNYAQNRIYVANFYSSSVSVIRDVTGIEEDRKQNASRLILQIYPNPAKTFFIIHSPAAVQSVKMYDVLGKLIKAEELAEFNDEKQISLKGISSGIYFLKVNTEETEFIKKLIVTK